MKCSICFATFHPEFPCSAAPINNGSCCPTCDDLIVTPVRIARATGLPILNAVNAGVKIHKHTREMKRRLRHERIRH